MLEYPEGANYIDIRNGLYKKFDTKWQNHLVTVYDPEEKTIKLAITKVKSNM